MATSDALTLDTTNRGTVAAGIISATFLTATFCISANATINTSSIHAALADDAFGAIFASVAAALATTGRATTLAAIRSAIGGGLYCHVRSGPPITLPTTITVTNAAIANIVTLIAAAASTAAAILTTTTAAVIVESFRQEPRCARHQGRGSRPQDLAVRRRQRTASPPRRPSATPQQT
jgi:hypothetical protein